MIPTAAATTAPTPSGFTARYGPAHAPSGPRTTSTSSRLATSIPITAGPAASRPTRSTSSLATRRRIAYVRFIGDDLP